MQLVDVCVNLPVKQLNNTFTYRLPGEFAQADVGWRVLVPFSGNVVEGFIIKKYLGSYEESTLKEVEELIDQSAWFDDKMLALAKWLSEYYLCTLAEAMRLFLPGKKSINKKLVYKLNDEVKFTASDVYEERLFTLLQAGVAFSREQIKARLGCFDETVIKKMLQTRNLLAEKQITSKFKQQMLTVVKLACDAKKYLHDNPKCPKARGKALQLLQVNSGEITAPQLQQQGVGRDTLLRMQKIGLVVIEQKHVVRNSYNAIVKSENNIVLNKEQQDAVERIFACSKNEQAKTFLLHGVTGSGKTQVYLEVAKAVYQEGKQVLMLVPEIALTGQTIKRFKECFAQDVLVFHSRLSLNERMDVFEYVKTGAPCVLIGVRSAVFAPFNNLGLVIIDEEHEYSYKQEERPGYHARDVAQKLAEFNNAPFLLGSATPGIESYYKSLANEYILLELSQRPINAVLPEVVFADMKEELHKGNRGVVSQKLLTGLKEVLERKEQAIVLLNRRGFATFVMCRDCGYAEKCEHCAVSLVYHQKDSLLRCHYCGYTKAVPDVCPVCKSRRIKFFGSGTQKAEQQLAQELPEIRIVRMDQDTTAVKMGHDKILDAFRKGEYDLLLGTQMVAKGHDVHNVTLVGVLAADAMLNLPDFRACERTFALLTQAAGRAGRGDKKGFVVLQAYETEHPVLAFVKHHDYKGFYQYEIEARKELFYPPYSSLLKISISGKSKIDAFNKAQYIVDKLKEQTIHCNGRLYINGPFAGMIEKVKDMYRAIIIIKTDCSDFVKEIMVAQGFASQKDIMIDIDPLNVI